jgi:hypothetical protein
MMNWKGFGRKWLWPDQGTIPALPGVLKESQNKP